MNYFTIIIQDDLREREALRQFQSALPPYTAKRASPTPDGRSDPTSEKMNVTRSAKWSLSVISFSFNTLY